MSLTISSLKSNLTQGINYISEKLKTLWEFLEEPDEDIQPDHLINNEDGISDVEGFPYSSLGVSKMAQDEWVPKDNH